MFISKEDLALYNQVFIRHKTQPNLTQQNTNPLTNQPFNSFFIQYENQSPKLF